MDMKEGIPSETTSPVVWMTGLPGAGKTTTANALRKKLLDRGVKAIVLDGDTLRTGLCSDLGFSDADRLENIRRFAHVAKLFQQEGYFVIVATISPFHAQRSLARTIVGKGFLEVFISTPVDVCRARDPKGMYAKAQKGQMTQFTGVSGAYELPLSPDIVVDTSNGDVEISIEDLLFQLKRTVELPVSL